MLRPLAWCLGLGAASTALTLGTGGAAAPFVAALVGGVVGGAAGNYGHELCQVLHQEVAGKLLDGRSGIAENHVVIQALRLAQLKALDTVLERFNEAHAHTRNLTQRDEVRRFSAELFHFITQQRVSAETLAFFRDAVVSPQEQQLRRSVLDALPGAFDQGLAARRESGDRAAIAQSFGQIRRVVETAVMTELRLNLLVPSEEPPPPFPTLFLGAATADGWFDLFIRDAADRVRDARAKDGGAFEKIWNTEQLALVKAIQATHTAVFAEINARTRRIEQTQTELKNELTTKMDELLALARAGGAFQRAAEEGISANAVRAIVERLGGEGIGQNDLLLWLNNWIDAAREQLGRHSNEGEAFEVARREAERRFKAGYLREASAAFMDELAREERLEAGRQAERKHHRIRLIEEAIRFDEVALNAAAVIPKLFIIADIEGVSGADARSAWLEDKAQEFYNRGHDKGINAALVIAIELRRVVLEEQTRERVPLDWAMTQMNLGTALLKLGEREAGTARLEQAVSAYQAALEELTRERVPLDWAGTQMNLGTALQVLGGREAGTARLEEAVTAYRAALEELTRERVPLDWAGTQMNLGTALQVLGGREAGTARLEQAVTAYRAALEELTRERVPLDWAATQMNLGTALQVLGGREAGTARLEEAVIAYRAALEEHTRERVPLNWAATQNNLGAALRRLGARETGTARLEQAVSAYRAALEEHTRERVPLDWAATQTNLGTALRVLGGRETGTARLEEAVTAYRAALEELTRERVPLDWAATQTNLGTALQVLGGRETGTARLEQAVNAYQAALEELTRERVPLDWAATQTNLGTALQVLGKRETGTARLEEAVSAYQAALEELTRERVPLDWAMTQANLEHTLNLIGERKA